MAPSAGYLARVRLTTSPVAHTAEAFANSDGGDYLEYQITTVARRILWIPDGLTVKVNGSPVTNYTMNALFGIVTFDSALLNTDVVTADTNYLPLTTIAEAKEATAKFQTGMLDTTAFGDLGNKTCIGGVQSLTIDMAQVVGTFTEITTGATLDNAVVTDASTIVVEMSPNSSGHDVIRAFVRVASAETKAMVAALVEGSVSFISRWDTDEIGSCGFSWGVDN